MHRFFFLFFVLVYAYFDNIFFFNEQVAHVHNTCPHISYRTVTTSAQYNFCTTKHHFNRPTATLISLRAVLPRVNSIWAT